MSKALGYTCDGPSCSTFVAANDNKLPIGWMTLTVHTDQDRSLGIFELCSNKCVKQLATERERADREPSGRDAVGHRTQHVAKGIVNPDCSYCQVETAPTNGVVQ